MKTLLFSLLIAVALPAAAQTDAAPTAAPARPQRRALPPEAFTTPTNFVVLVDLSGKTVDGSWLAEQAAAMQRSLQVGVMVAYGPFENDGDPRKTARDIFESIPEAKVLVMLAEGEDLPPILASPYENWVVMDAGWVKRGGGDESLVNARMGKRIYQALGACCGAAYRPEREAVMRYSPTPESMDDCRSRNFHPLNANSFGIVARAIGLQPIRLRPRKELVEMGILVPRPAPAPAETPAETPTETPVETPAE